VSCIKGKLACGLDDDEDELVSTVSLTNGYKSSDGDADQCTSTVDIRLGVC